MILRGNVQYHMNEMIYSLDITMLNNNSLAILVSILIYLQCLATVISKYILLLWKILVRNVKRKLC